MKPKTVKVPSRDDIREFIDAINANSIAAATAKHRGIKNDPPGVAKTYKWLLALAEASDGDGLG